ncbi:hypothetical protein BRADI_1g73744v3 [Brachypodium distachyon]|uniref:F-box domain-containing protein n=2 Tax=Brachypodium distachyon TaxID=15368 RepID=A0A2K2DV02_BRADI|nr:hypothetical protein BRADI_1g73744v3 [Brachypodium distachyon]
MREIFLRVPPDDPASLVRAAAVCKAWRAILLSSDDAASFARDYRAFHGPPPPMLGFLHNKCYKTHCLSHFVSTTATPSFRPPACHGRRHWYALDSRHGRALFYTPKSDEDFVVCDPITDDRWAIHADPRYSDVMWKPQDGDEDEEEKTWNAAVLCAKDRCDHLDCHGGPFLVAFVGSDEQRGTFASVYSSETDQWSKVIFLNQPNAIMEAGHSAVLGSKVYFPCKQSTQIVEFNMGEHKLAVINKPFNQAYLALVGVEDGMLLFAGLRESKLHLLSMEAGPNGAVAWVRCRIIALKPLLPSRALLKASVVGFAEGIGAIFLSTEAGLFKIELNSGRSRKIYRKMFFEKIMPYTSFYTGVRNVGGCSGRASGAGVTATTAM